MWTDKLFDLIGSLLFPKQQDWQRRKNARLTVAAISLGILVGLVMWAALNHMNQISR